MSEAPSTWQRIKTNVKNFTNHALSYIPRGIILTGLVFAAVAGLQAVTHVPLLGDFSSMPSHELASRFVGQLMIGSIISGVIGASMAPCPPAETTSATAQARNTPAKTQAPQKGMVQQITEGLASTATKELGNFVQHAATEAVAPGATPITAVAQAAAHSMR